MPRLPLTKPGYALATMLILLGVAMFSAAASVGVSALESKISRSQREGVSAYYAAEAGLQDAVWRMNNDSSYVTRLANNQFQPTSGTPFGYTLASPALGTYQSAQIAIQSTANNYATVTVTGRSDSGSFISQRVLSADIFQSAGTSNAATGTNAFMTGGSFSLTNNSTTVTVTGGDWYSAGSTSVNLNGSGARLNLGSGYLRTSGAYNYNGGGQIITAGVQAGVATQTPPGVNFATYTATGGSTVTYNLSNNTQQNNFRSAITSTAGLPGPITLVQGNLNINSWGANRTLKVNGLLVINGSLTTSANNCVIQVDDPGNGRAGILVNGNANINNCSFVINGVLYTSAALSMNNTQPTTINGVMVAGGAVNMNTGVNLTINYNSTRSAAVLGGTAGSYASDITHWEEEY